MKFLSKLVLVSVVLTLVLSSSIVFAEYQPRPGVLPPSEVDFGGKTVTIIRGGLPAPERVAEAEALFNVKLDALRLENADQIMARIMAGDSKYDIIRAPHREGYFTLVAAEMLLPADEHLPEEFFETLPTTDRYIIEKLMYNGHRYGIGVHEGVVNETMYIMPYNKALIEAYGQPDPYELYLAGEWTYDALEKIAVALTQDTDGDGVIDQWGITTANEARVFWRFAGSNGAELAKKDENGKWVFAFNQADAVAAFNTVKKWLDMGLMGATDQFNQGKVGFKLYDWIGGNRNAIAAGIKLGMVPFPKGPHVDEHKAPAYDFRIVYLPVNVEYPEGLIALANFLWREEDTYERLDNLINNYTTSAEHYNLYMEVVANWRGEGDVFQGTELWNMLTRPVNQALKDEQSFTAAMDEMAPVAQAFLDDFFGR